MSKILVTGGAGFIGSHLCERLAIDPNNEVWSLDNYSTGSKNNHVDGVTYITGSTLNINQLIFEPDIIFHLGEYSRVEQSFQDFEKVWESNVNGTYEVLKFARENHAKLIYAGSSTKFADDGSGPNQSPYAFTKSNNTQLVQNFGDWYGINYAITYFYNVYGEREISTGKYATVIAKFEQQVKRGEILQIVSPGTQLRNFTHIDDIIDGLILVGEQGSGDGYGIGSDEAFSVLDVAKMYGSKYEIVPARSGNRLTASVVTDKTKALGWLAKRNLKQYIGNKV